MKIHAMRLFMPCAAALLLAACATTPSPGESGRQVTTTTSISGSEYVGSAGDAVTDESEAVDVPTVQDLCNRHVRPSPTCLAERKGLP
jgi:outer membrane PBP1 activator LpoA protein